MKTALQNLSVAFLLMTACSACKLLDIDPNVFRAKCESHVPQRYKFGYVDVNVSTTRKDMRVGDTLFIKAHVSENFYDSLSRQTIAVQRRLGLFFRVTTAMTGPPNPSVFAIDTTIYNVFDNYFTTVLRTGKKLNHYTYDAVYQNGFWDLDVIFIARRTGAFEVHPETRWVQTNETLPERVCMLGDSEKYQAKARLQAVNNRYTEIYPIQYPETEQHYGFIVK